MSTETTTEEQDREDALRRAFVDGKADYVRIDGHSGLWLTQTIAYGQEKGWLTDGVERGDSQWTEFHYRLTDEGKEHFGL